MEYGMYLKYVAAMNIGLHGCSDDLVEHYWSHIMHWTDKDKDDENNKEEDIKIGFLFWATYNQALAKVHGINMSDIQYFANRKPLQELDYSNITQETIDEIGPTSNPNIVLIYRFGISAAWRNKRLGEEIVKGFIEQMKGKCGYIVISYNVPAQFGDQGTPDFIYTKQGIELESLEKDPEKAQWKLNAFWQRCGFKQFKNYDNVFICNVDQAVPYPDEIAHTAGQLT